MSWHLLNARNAQMHAYNYTHIRTQQLLHDYAFPCSLAIMCVWRGVWVTRVHFNFLFARIFSTLLWHKWSRYYITALNCMRSWCVQQLICADKGICAFSCLNITVDFSCIEIIILTSFNELNTKNMLERNASKRKYLNLYKNIANVAIKIYITYIYIRVQRKKIFFVA